MELSTWRSGPDVGSVSDDEILTVSRVVFAASDVDWSVMRLAGSAVISIVVPARVADSYVIYTTAFIPIVLASVVNPIIDADGLVSGCRITW